MFKQSKHCLHQTKRITVMNNAPRREVQSKHLFMRTEDDHMQEKKKILNLYAEMDGPLGVVKINREHRMNTLSPSLVEDITRGVNSVYQDHYSHVIYLGTAKGLHFCNGSDFRTLAHMQRENANDRIQEYMQHLYDMQVTAASINKPLIAVAPGYSANSGAALLAACSHPMTTPTTKVSFNETQFGFVPHGGGAFHMSRLPGEFGTFMALTGLKINGEDATLLDISRDMVNDPLEYHQYVSDAVYNVPMKYPGGYDIFKSKRKFHFHTAWEDHVLTRDSHRQQLATADGNRYHRQRKELGHIDDLVEPDDRVPSSVAEANQRYMHRIRLDAERNAHKNESSYMEFHNTGKSDIFLYQNYFQEVMNLVKQEIGQPWSKLQGDATRHRELIDRCFYPNTVEEIMDNLSKETHPFAAHCLEAMKRNSPQSMQLALKMLRKAINLDYKGCLQMELNVVFNRLQDSDFQLGVQQVYQATRERGSSFKKRPDWAAPLKESEMDRYFDLHPIAKTIKIDVVEHALLPTKNFYDRFSDQVRLWLNQTTTTQPIVREAFAEEAKHALLEQGVDVRDMALSPEIARNHLCSKIAIERSQKIQNERAMQLMTDQKLRDKYFGQVNELVKRLEEDKQYYYDKLNAHVKEIFEGAFINRLNDIHVKSQHAHNLEKRRLILRLKQYYFYHRIIEWGDDKQQQHREQILSQKFKHLHLNEKWDQSWRNMEHPDLVHTPLYYLSKAIGRVDLTIPELTQSYLTDPANRQQMQMFTIDKDELEKLNDDILSNPEKYEMILRGAVQPEILERPTYKLNLERKWVNFEERDYWFRMMHTCKSDIETLPYYDEFTAYKEWVDQIEMNALATLRTAINKLLIEHENTPEYSGKLRKLVKLVNDDAKLPELETKQVKVTTEINQPRSHKDTQQLLRGMLQSNRHLGHLFKGDFNENPQVQELTEKFETELLRMIELVLLDRQFHDENPTKEQRKQWSDRLTELTTAKNSMKSSLKIIDPYLGQAAGQALLKDVFDLVAPFFLQYAKNLLDEEIERCLQTFDWDTKQPEYMMYYYLSQSTPGIFQDSTLRRFMYYQPEKEAYETVSQMFPGISPMQQRKEYNSILGSKDLDPSKPLSEQKFDSLEMTREELKIIENFENSTIKNEQDLDFPVCDDIEEQDEKQEWDDTELTLLAIKFNRIMDAHDYLLKHKYEIDHHMNRHDGLHYIAESVHTYNMDPSTFLREDDLPRAKELAQYAQFVDQLAFGLSKAAEESLVDATKFMELQNMTTKQKQGFYATARAERERMRQKLNAEETVDRVATIKRQITDFNDLQREIQAQKEQAEAMKKLLLRQPRTLQREIDLFMADNNFIKQDVLFSKIKQNDFSFLKDPSQVVDMQKAVQSAKGSLSQWDSAIDVVSLHQLKETLQDDPSLTSQDRQNLKTVINYVSDQAKYISNADRKELKLSDFMHKHTFTSPAAFENFATSLLRDKIERMLGKAEQADAVEWQINDVRTMPAEHLFPRNEALTDGHSKVDAKSAQFDLVNAESKQGEAFDQYGDPVYAADEDFNYTSPDEQASSQEIKKVFEAQTEYERSQRQTVQHDVYGIGREEEDSLRDFENKKAYREMREACEIPQQMESTKNFYEHKILNLMMEPQMDQERISNWVEEYMQLRMREATSHKNFQKHLQSENASTLLKILREQVVDELGIGKANKGSDLMYENITSDFNVMQFYDIEHSYNTQHFNNQNAIGFDHVEKRAQSNTAAGNYEAAHESVFDKLLAEYYLNKRGQYKQANKLVDELGEIFGDSESKNMVASGMNKMTNLHQAALKQSLGQSSEPFIQPSNMRDLMQLDVATARFMQKNKNGLRTDLRHHVSLADKDHPDWKFTQVPAYYDTMDVRKPPEQYLNDKFRAVIQECFTLRQELERTMTRNELMAFDTVLARYLQRRSLMARLKEALEADYAFMHSFKNTASHFEDGRDSEQMQFLKYENDQVNYNRKIKNTDAQFKWLAFSAMNEKRNKKLSDENNDLDPMYNDNSFDQYYKRQLMLDAQRPARPINEDDFKKRKPWDKPVGAPWMDETQRKTQLFKDHEIYLEKKLEQQDRIQLFYVLEQFYEQARQNPDKSSEGQKIIKEYFADPDNTYFFEKNKIQ